MDFRDGRRCKGDRTWREPGPHHERAAELVTSLVTVRAAWASAVSRHRPHRHLGLESPSGLLCAPQWGQLHPWPRPGCREHPPCARISPGVPCGESQDTTAVLSGRASVTWKVGAEQSPWSRAGPGRSPQRTVTGGRGPWHRAGGDREQWAARLQAEADDGHRALSKARRPEEAVRPSSHEGPAGVSGCGASSGGHTVREALSTGPRRT